MASSDDKVSNHITDDVAFIILSKLSLKALKRFTCVRKSWVHLIEDPNFICMFCDRNLASALNTIEVVKISFL